MSSTITVKNFYEPDRGKKFGSIIDTNGNRWGALPGLISRIYRGADLQITETSEWKSPTGRTYYTIREANVLGESHTQNRSYQQQSRGPSAPARQTVNPEYAAQEERKRRDIFVCGALNSVLHNPNINPDSLSNADLVTYVEKFKTVFEATLGPNAGRIQITTGPQQVRQPTEPGQPFDEEIGDQIPF